MNQLRIIVMLIFCATSLRAQAVVGGEDSLMQVLPTLRADTNKVKTLTSLVWVLLNEDKASVAQPYLTESLRLSDSLHYAFGQASALRFIAYIKSYSGELAASLQLYNKALEITKANGLRQQHAKILVDMYRLDLKQHMPEKAQERLLEALQVFKELGDRSSEATCLTNLGSVAEARGDNEAYLRYNLASGAIYNELGDSVRYAGTLNNLGVYYHHTNQLQKALDMFLMTERIYRSQDNPRRLANAINSCGELLLALGKRSAARQRFTESIAVYRSDSDVAGMHDVLLSLSRLDSAEGKWKGAYENYLEYSRIQDSLTKSDNIDELTRAQLEYEAKSKEEINKAEQARKDALATAELKRQLLLRNGFLLGFAIVFVFAFIVFRQRNSIRRGKQQSDELLLNILPSEVANELKSKGSADARQFDNVTVLFTDFKSFTRVSEQLSPKALVDELHTCFTAFDTIISRYHIEKIKTIGDAYLAVSGLPAADPEHAQNIVRAALEIREYMRQRHEQQGDKSFEIRIGVNSGSVVAGIVGVKKFAYDIWGDAVNTAARMEQNCEAGCINVSASTHALIHKEFVCEYRGEIEAKNKGQLAMYYVVDRSN